MPMGKTISFVKGKGSISHNNRDFIAENVDRNRTAWNVEYIKQPIREAYNQLFGEAIAEYNAKQKRKDRQVTDYLKDIKNSGNGEKQFYEIVVQIGKKDDTGVLDSEGNLSVDAKAASEILDEYARSFQERNPNLYLFNAVLHMDEATPHLHLDYIPVAHGYKTKMHTRNSLTKALQEMGIAPAVSKTDNETTHWQEREREYLKGLCLERGIEVEILGVKRDNYTIPEYKVAMRATEELTAELEILNAEKQEAESVIASVGAEIADAREEVEESKKHLDEINEQIADREKRYAVYEKKIDKVLAAGKPVAKELAVIRKNAKQLPSILGSEPSVKISEKDFNRLIDMAQASGTLEKLNEIYDRELEHMQGIIDDLMVQVKTWKDKVLQYDKFFNVKGLVEELKELFIKAANKLFSERDEILANTKVMMEMVCETDSLDRDLQDSITELNIISEQMQIAIAENSRVALNQDEYEKHYAELTARYEKAKAGYDDIAEQIESKKAKRELFKGFIRTLEKQDGLTCEFDAGIWSSLVQEVIVKAKDDIRFIFKNGFEVRV